MNFDNARSGSKQMELDEFRLRQPSHPTVYPGSDLCKLFTYQENNTMEGCILILGVPFYTQN